MARPMGTNRRAEAKRERALSDAVVPRLTRQLLFRRDTWFRVSSFDGGHEVVCQSGETIWLLPGRKAKIGGRWSDNTPDIVSTMERSGFRCELLIGPPDDDAAAPEGD